MPPISPLAGLVMCLAVGLPSLPAAAQSLLGQPSAQTGPRVNSKAAQAAEYQKCMTLARRRPQDGFEMAIGWRSLGGGDAADHCAAVALIELEQFGEAAKRLERLAQISIEEPPVKAGLYDQAGQPWSAPDPVIRICWSTGPRPGRRGAITTRRTRT